MVHACHCQYTYNPGVNILSRDLFGTSFRQKQKIFQNRSRNKKVQRSICRKFLTGGQNVHPWLIPVGMKKKAITYCLQFPAVDRYRCIIQPEKPAFSAGIALLISSIMTWASILLSLPMYLSAEVSKCASVL